MTENFVSGETLIAQWRRKASDEYISAQIAFGGFECNEARAQAPAYRACADELAAHLHAQKAPEVCKTCGHWKQSATCQCVSAPPAQAPTRELRHQDAVFVFYDATKQHFGPFDGWPEVFKNAWANAVIDPSPLSDKEIAHAQELAAKMGWLRDAADGECTRCHGTGTEPEAAQATQAPLVADACCSRTNEAQSDGNAEDRPSSGASLGRGLTPEGGREEQDVSAILQSVLQMIGLPGFDKAWFDAQGDRDFGQLRAHGLDAKLAEIRAALKAQAAHGAPEGERRQPEPAVGAPIYDKVAQTVSCPACKAVLYNVVPAKPRPFTLSDDDEAAALPHAPDNENKDTR